MPVIHGLILRLMGDGLSKMKKENKKARPPA
jgi:hypothetical protein